MFDTREQPPQFQPPNPFHCLDFLLGVLITCSPFASRFLCLNTPFSLVYTVIPMEHTFQLFPKNFLERKRLSIWIWWCLSSFFLFIWYFEWLRYFGSPGWQPCLPRIWESIALLFLCYSFVCGRHSNSITFLWSPFHFLEHDPCSQYSKSPQWGSLCVGVFPSGWQNLMDSSRMEMFFLQNFLNSFDWWPFLVFFNPFFNNFYYSDLDLLN